MHPEHNTTPNTAVVSPSADGVPVEHQPGHGVPSQDPSPAAQVALSPAEAEREAGSVLAGGGVMAGAATGAAVGGAVGGPIGIVVGVAVGGVAGAVGGAAVSKATVDPSARGTVPPLPEATHEPDLPR